jgi:hypothetical protein
MVLITADIWGWLDSLRTRALTTGLPVLVSVLGCRLMSAATGSCGKRRLVDYSNQIYGGDVCAASFTLDSRIRES